MRGFLALLSRAGAQTIALGAFETAASPDAQRALRTEGVVRPGPLARTYSCGADEPGCSREVRGFEDDDDLGLDAPNAARPIRDRIAPRVYVAVCSQSPHACPFVEVESDALAQVTIVRDPLARAIARLLGLSTVPRAPHAIEPPKDDEPLLLGEEARDGAVRDVFLLVRPRRDLAHRLGARERDARPATFFVPSAHGVDATLFTRHGAGAHVELARLDDAIAVRGGVLVATPRLRVVRGESQPSRARAAKDSPAPPLSADGVRPLPPLERWNDLRVCKVDGETILLTLYGVSSRRTHVDMGMAAKNNRKPVKAWRVLMEILEEEGRFTWSHFGNYLAAEKAVSDLRIFLRRALGTDLDPFESLDDGEGWRPRFEAKKDPPKDKMPGKGRKN